MIFSNIKKNNYIYIILLLGLTLRVLSYIYFPSYESCDGYIFHGRIIFESNAHGRDRQFFKDMGVDSENIDQDFNNPSSPLIRVNGKEIILTASHPIGWPLQIALLYSVFGNNNIDAVLIYNLIISTLTILIFYLVSKNLFNISVALITSVIVALNPIFIMQSSVTTTETTFLFFLFLSVYFFIKSYNSNQIIFYSLFGALLAFTSLIRSVAFLYIFALLFFIIIIGKFRKKILISLIAFIIVLSPWIIRNYIVFSSFIPMTNLSGIVFYQGNNKYVFNKRHGSWMSQNELWRKANLDKNQKTEIELKKIAFRDGFDFLKSLSLMELINHEWYKIRYAFCLSYKYFLYKPGTFNLSISHKVVYYPLLFLTVFYFIKYNRYKNELNKNGSIFMIIFFSGFIIFLIQTLVFFGYPRYRAYLLDPFLILSASASIYYILCKLALLRKEHKE